MGAVVDQLAIDPDFDFIRERLNYQRVPLADRFFRAFGQIENPASLAFGDSPGFLRSTSLDHIWHGDVFHDAPEIPRVLVIHLDFN